VKIRAPQDFWAGTIFACIGLIALGQERHYPIGTLTAMGPGYFPLMLSTLLTVLGLVCMAKGLLQTGASVEGRWPLAPLIVLVIGIALFAYLIEATGMLAAVFMLALLIGYGEIRRHPVQVVGSAVILSIAATLIFVQFLGMPIRAY
jgi:hypothetical protein